MKKIRSFLALTVVMMLIITACLGTQAMAETADAPQSYTAGTYTATVPGRNGDITVEVTFEADRIASVNVVAHNETAGISDGAINGIPASIVDDQTLAVDAVSNATITSDAILSAVEDCERQAGGDPDTLKTRADQEGTLTAGIYEGTARGYMGNVTVHVTVDDSSIVKVDVVFCTDMPANISRVAVAQIPQSIVDHQSVKVDSVSGATFTSNAIKAAVTDALTKAGNAGKFAVEVEAPLGRRVRTKPWMSWFWAAAAPAVWRSCMPKMKT